MVFIIVPFCNTATRTVKGTLTLIEMVSNKFTKLCGVTFPFAK